MASPASLKTEHLQDCLLYPEFFNRTDSELNRLEEDLRHSTQTAKWVNIAKNAAYILVAGLLIVSLGLSWLSIGSLVILNSTTYTLANSAFLALSSISLVASTYSLLSSFKKAINRFFTQKEKVNQITTDRLDAIHRAKEYNHLQNASKMINADDLRNVRTMLDTQLQNHPGIKNNSPAELNSLYEKNKSEKHKISIFKNTYNAIALILSSGLVFLTGCYSSVFGLMGPLAFYMRDSAITPTDKAHFVKTATQLQATYLAPLAVATVGLTVLTSHLNKKWNNRSQALEEEQQAISAVRSYQNIESTYTLDCRNAPYQQIAENAHEPSNPNSFALTKTTRGTDQASVVPHSVFAQQPDANECLPQTQSPLILRRLLKYSANT